MNIGQAGAGSGGTGGGEVKVCSVCVCQVRQACIKGLPKQLRSNNGKRELKDTQVAILIL